MRRKQILVRYVVINNIMYVHYKYESRVSYVATLDPFRRRSTLRPPAEYQMSF